MNQNKKLAEGSLEIAQNIPDENDGTNPQAMTALAFAQVHATLYLAEQQRFGNIISYFNTTGDLIKGKTDTFVREGMGL